MPTGAVLRLGELSFLGGAEEGFATEMWLLSLMMEGGMLRLRLRDGIPRDCRRSGHRKLFYPCPLSVCRLLTMPHAYCSTAQTRQFCSNFAPAAHSWSFIFQLVSGGFPHIVRSAYRCSCPRRLKVIVTPSLKSKQPCLSPWAASCN